MSDSIKGRTENIMEVDAYGGIDPSRSILATCISVTASTAAGVVIAASNPFRKGLILQNVSTAILWMKYGTDAATTAIKFTQKLGNSTQVTSTFAMQGPSIYCGPITGCWDATNGYVAVTEF
jgi:hypothetical protein